MLPALFVSHGSPAFPMSEVPAKRFLETLPTLLDHRPLAILVVSAHWESEEPAVNSVESNETIHDFYGFPPELYEITYPAPGSPGLAERVQALLGAAGLAVRVDHRRGLDHGAWVPLRLAFPAADIPVVQLSVQTERGAGYHHRLGQLLAPLREEGVLIVGSGSFTHDLSSFRQYRHAIDAPEPEWVTRFANWMEEALREQRLADLLAYRSLAPESVRNHPTEEHLLPIFVALGAGGGRVHHLHKSSTHGILRMDVYAFDAAPEPGG
ncbi:MAG: dioxygenase [Pseudomonadota bacterium]|nr:dioxygenase [Pseudomonadota bacterium]